MWFRFSFKGQINKSSARSKKGQVKFQNVKFLTHSNLKKNSSFIIENTKNQFCHTFEYKTLNIFNQKSDLWV